MDERFWSAAEQGRAMAKGRLDPVEMAEAYLEAAAAVPESRLSAVAVTSAFTSA